MIPFYFITLFPKELSQYLLKGLILKAVKSCKISLHFIDLRSFSKDKFHVDDQPFSEKKGMLLKADVLYDAITSIDQFDSFRLLCPSPEGALFNQDLVKSWLPQTKGYVFIMGYYEGIDERLFDALPIQKISLGDMVLSSGELPSLVMADAIIRLIPGVMGNEACIADDSFENHLLEYPQYTRPKKFQSWSVPDLLTSGHHKHIQEWRTLKKLEQTCFKRPDLFAKACLTDDEKKIFKTLMEEFVS